MGSQRLCRLLLAAACLAGLARGFSWPSATTAWDAAAAATDHVSGVVNDAMASANELLRPATSRRQLQIFVRTSMAQDLEQASYEGRWFIVGRTVSDALTERARTLVWGGRTWNAQQDTYEDWALQPNGRFFIYKNSQRRSTVFPKIGTSTYDFYYQSIQGESFFPDTTPGGSRSQLRTYWGDPITRYIKWLTNIGENHWIYGVGPKNVKNEYAWSIVSNPTGGYLMLMFREQYKPSDYTDPTSELNQYLADIQVICAQQQLPYDELVFDDFDFDAAEDEPQIGCGTTYYAPTTNGNCPF